MQKSAFVFVIALLSLYCSGNGVDQERNADPLPMEMVEVSAGEFEMGDNFGEGQANELPVHIVYLDTYFIGKYEVTNAEYERFMDDGGYSNAAYWEAGGFGNYGSRPEEWTSTEWQGGGISGNENIPVVGVCWYEAMAFCSWMSAKTGDTYRLPTEAEWEKAARGDSIANAALGHQRRYPWGDDIDGHYTNYYQSGDTYENRGGNGGMTPVGYFNGSTQENFLTQNNASPYGAYDMAGNVWELCLDWYGENYYANSPGNNPMGPDSGTNKVMRSGARHSGVMFVRSAFRENGTRPTTRSASMGFRYVREPSSN